VNDTLAAVVAAQAHAAQGTAADGHTADAAAAAAAASASPMAASLATPAARQAAAVVVTFNTEAAARACLAELGPLAPTPGVLKGLLVGGCHFLQSCCRACVGTDPLAASPRPPLPDRRHGSGGRPSASGGAHGGGYARVALAEEEHPAAGRGRAFFRPGYVPRCSVPLPPERVRWSCVGAAGVDRR
jgi:hypothetical protein